MNNKSLQRATIAIVSLVIFMAGCGLTHTPRFLQLNERRVTGIGSFDIPLHWSPDGKHLAYQGGSSVHVIIQDVAERRSWSVGKPVPHPDGPIHTFAWHPTGRISYLKWRYTPGGISIDGVEELHLADMDGQNDTIVVDNLPFGVDYIWLPDGRELIMRWAAKRSNDLIDDVYIVDSVTGQREVLITHEELNLGIISMALLPDENILLLNGIRELSDGRSSYFVLYNLSQRRVVKEIHLDPLFVSGTLPDYPTLRPHIGSFSLNYVKSGPNQWIIGDFWAPAGECYNYAIYFFNLNDVSRNFCIPSEKGPTGAISVSPDGKHIAYSPTDGPGRAWIMVAELTPEILAILER